MSDILNDPEMTRLVIYTLAGLCAVLFLAVLFLAIKKNIYYVDSNGNELPPKKRIKGKHKVSANEEPQVQPEPEVPVEETTVIENPVEENLTPEVEEMIEEVSEEDMEKPTTKEVPIVKPDIYGALVVVKINNEVYEHTIERLPCLIGRDKESCDFVINEPAVSRRHARIIMTTDGIFLEDVSEHNGTYLNGVKLPSLGRAPLKENDKINLGRAELTVTRFLY